MEFPPIRLRAIWSFLLYIPWLLGSAANLSNETDRLALLHFKHLITEDPFHSLSSWNHTLHFCHWQGVTCNGRRHPQRVTELNLTGQKLVGPISPFIGNLTFLRTIDLGENYFHGSIPQEMGRLFRLQYLSLLNNTFTGEIPENLTHCLKLEFLHLYRNQLIGRIPIELGSLPKLSYLILSHNNLVGSIPPSLGNISSLTYLHLTRNSLDGSIPEELCQLVNLNVFSVGGNELSDSMETFLLTWASVFQISKNFMPKAINSQDPYQFHYPMLQD
ncbi:putative receptor-like protein kinase At3g47110 [Magnolia sinica]|uniref:putative receptor-like protein kinase At3g47110 n=1 Tax=Magnolia sinica TaxID=86752 RepID=UPI002658E262|nr:putative receptor-like protein kinase At3g47110 [Magnolia sinica]